MALGEPQRRMKIAAHCWANLFNEIRGYFHRSRVLRSNQLCIGGVPFRRVAIFVLAAFFALLEVALSPAQSRSPLQTALGFGAWPKPAPQLPAAEGLEDHVANGKLVLSLDDSIRMALANNTDIRIDRSQIDFALDNLHRSHSPFDPVATSSFSDTRAKSLPISTLQGAPLVSNLTQNTLLGYQQLFPTGTNFQTSFSASKNSSSNSFNTVNPSLQTVIQFTVTQ